MLPAGFSALLRIFPCSAFEPASQAFFALTAPRGSNLSSRARKAWILDRTRRQEHITVFPALFIQCKPACTLSFWLRARIYHLLSIFDVLYLYVWVKMRMGPGGFEPPTFATSRRRPFWVTASFRKATNQLDHRPIIERLLPMLFKRLMGRAGISNPVPYGNGKRL